MHLAKQWNTRTLAAAAGGNTGTVELNPGGTALYTMTRDDADYMMITSAGLWIGSVNKYTVNKCGDLTGPPGHNAADHAGICLLPYSG